MMDFGPYKFEMRDGWPPDGERGQFFGFDADMNVAVLRWVDGNWHGVRFQYVEQARRRTQVQPFMRSKDTEYFVVRWAAAPWADGFEKRVSSGFSADAERPTPIAFTTFEGGGWRHWSEREWAKNPFDMSFHAVHFDDGSEFDVVNGWRSEPGPYPFKEMG